MKELKEQFPGIEQFWENMKQTPQNPNYHGEGDVFAHTQLVCEKLLSLPAWHTLQQKDREALYLAAALHDAGKTFTTRMEDDQLVSPHHASVGAQRVREFLWKDCGFSGSFRKLAFREAVCNLIRYHGLPVFAFDRPDGILQLAQFAEGPASVQMLTLLSQADVLGRIAPDVAQLHEQVLLTEALAEENGILYGPMQFASAATKRAWFSGRKVHPVQPLYDDSWGEVILMSGLPGTGKDTWIRQNCSLPMISLDDIRQELRIQPADNQLAVVKEARHRAKEFLRKKQPFVWNATNLTRRVRSEQIELFEGYGASVRIVYLETAWERNREQNRSRCETVPETVLESLLGILEPPMPWEAGALQAEMIT